MRSRAVALWAAPAIAFVATAAYQLWWRSALPSDLPFDYFNSEAGRKDGFWAHRLPDGVVLSVFVALLAIQVYRYARARMLALALLFGAYEFLLLVALGAMNLWIFGNEIGLFI